MPPVALLLCIALGFGTPGSDMDRLRTFSNAVNRWQIDPEFRAAGQEYATLGHEGMQARWWGQSTTSVVMWLRSLPFLPPTLDVDPTSQAHYDNFTRGPLSAYLHLCGESAPDFIIPELEKFARRGDLSDEAVAEFLRRNFQMDHPVVTDAGARSSLRKLVADTEAARTFTVRSDIRPALERHIDYIARSQGWGDSDPKAMSQQQQYEVLRRLDSEIAASDPELWRAKQVNDFVGGVWAQVYGPMYLIIIKPLTWARMICRVLTFAIAGWLGYRAYRWYGVWAQRRAAAQA